MKKNIVALLALLFITEYLPAMELDSGLENAAEKHQGQKRKTVGPLDKRDLKKVKLEVFLEEEEEASTQQIIQTEEPNDNELHFNWDGLPDEIQLFILSFLINTQNVITARVGKQCSTQFKQYALLKLVNKKMNDLASDKQLFDLISAVAHIIRENKQRSKQNCANKILINAAKYGYIYIIKLALKNGLKIAKYKYLLTDASRFKNIKLCKKLIQWGITEGTKNTALFNAICLHDTERVQTLIKSKKTIYFLSDKSTELIIASKVGNIDILCLLLNKNPQNINVHNSYGKTPLHIAAKKNDIKVTQILLSNHAEIEIKDSWGRTPLCIACSHGNIEIAQFLLNNHANIDAKYTNDRTALLIACYQGNIEIAQFLLNNHANIETKDANGNTALLIACNQGKIEIAQLLLNNRANVDAKDQHGRTALLIACNQGNIEIAQLLLNNHANIDAKDSSGKFALLIACNRGNIQLAELLLKNRANVDAKDQNGKTALHYSALSGYIGITQLLLDNQANIQAKDNNKETALDFAAKEGHINIAQLLNETINLIN